eukprot:3704772-Rhodomonas_salina.1
MAHLPASAWYAGLGQREEEEHGSEEGREERSGTSAQCEHGKRRSRCKECCGKNFCEHGKFRRADARCRECVIKLQASPSVATWLVLRALKPKGFKRDEFCMHDRRGANCPTCSPKRFCVHERRKERCKVSLSDTDADADADADGVGFVMVMGLVVVVVVMVMILVVVLVVGRTAERRTR